MADYTTNTGVMKREIFKFTEKISEGMARPFQKFAADMCYGAMASKSCLISEMAQALQEDTQKMNTIERLARHLGEGIPETVRDNRGRATGKICPSESAQPGVGTVKPEQQRTVPGRRG